MPIHNAHVARPFAEPLEKRRLLAAGDLVSGFGTGGLLNFDFDGEDVQFLRKVVETPDGDYIAAGESFGFGAEDGNDYLIRLNPADGSFDSGFDSDGVLALPEDADANGFVSSLLPLDDGDILYARRSSTETGGEIVRLNPDGMVDESFGTGGILAISGLFPDMALLPGGEILVAGGSIVRVYTADGAPRAQNFETDLLVQSGVDAFTFGDVDTDDDGNIYVAGAVSDDGSPRASVFKLDNDLDLIASYGQSGEARRDFAALDVFTVRSLDVDSQGRAIIAINEDDAENRLVRFSSAGAPAVDEAFRFTSNQGPTEPNELERAIAQRDGKIVAGGSFAVSADEVDPALARYEGASTDDSFGSGDPDSGQQRYDFDIEEAVLLDFVITSDDDVVAVGQQIDLPSFSSDAIVFKVDLGEIDDGGGGGEIGDVAGFTQLQNGTVNITGTSRNDRITFALEQQGGADVYAFTRADVGTGAQSVTARYFAEDVDEIALDALGGDDDVELTDLGLPATLVGQAGNDRIVYAGGAARIEGGAGNDTLVGGASGDAMFGGDGNDSVTGADGNDSLEGGAGNDSIQGGGSSDMLVGGEGGDLLAGGSGSDSIDGEGGNDTANITDADGDIGPDNYLGGSGSDTLNLSNRTGAIILGEGGPEVDSFEIILTGDGDDDLTIDDSAGAGTIEVRTGGGNDRIDASSRTLPVRIVSGIGADSIIGGSGNDLLLPGDGDNEDDVVEGGGGFDILDFSAAGGGLSLVRGSLGDGSAPIQIGDDVEIAWGGDGSDEISGFLRIRGGDGDDTLTGSRDEDTALFGQSGDDQLTSALTSPDGVPESRKGDYLDGGAGQDAFAGGIGDDTFAGGLGSDSYEDGGGINTISFANVLDDQERGADVDLAQSNGDFSVGGFTQSLEGVVFRDAVGSPFDDEIRGTVEPNYIFAGEGDDRVLGLGGKDILLGGSGSDTLEGGDDNDLLLGDTDTGDEEPNFADVLLGGSGFDRGLGDEDDEEDVEEFFTSMQSLLSQL